MSETSTGKIKGARIGFVESDKRDQSRRVVVDYLARHPKYGKYMRQRQVLHAHDPGNESKVGDRVEIAPCKPVSKTKSWRLVRIVDKAPEA